MDSVYDYKTNGDEIQMHIKNEQHIYYPLIIWLKKLLSIFIFENAIFQILYVENRKLYLRTFDVNMIDNIFTEFNIHDYKQNNKNIIIKYIKLLIKDIDPIYISKNRYKN